MEAIYRNRHFIKLPLVNLLLAAVLGTVIRYFIFRPFPGFNFLNWLQVHSHVMFLGWVTLALFILILERLNPPSSRVINYFLIVFQLAVLAMFISFPSAGYGILSVIVLSITMIAGIIIFAVVFRYTRPEKNTGWKFIRSGLLFMLLSSLGPLALGPISAMGLKNSIWYNYAIYFYLHFQYNGWFLMAILGLILLLAGDWESRNRKLLKRSWLILSSSILLTLFLSFLNHDGYLLLNLIGGAGAVAQLTVVTVVIRKFVKTEQLSKVFPVRGLLLLRISAIALLGKLLLQAFSALPLLTSFIFNNRNVIIAYLHLVLIGFVSFSILFFYVNRQDPEKHKVLRQLSEMVLLAGFFLNEFVLMVSVTGGIAVLVPALLFIASVMMVLGFLGLTVAV